MKFKNIFLLGIVVITVALTTGCNTFAKESNDADNTEQNHTSNQTSSDSHHPSSSTDAMEKQTSSGESNTVVEKNNSNPVGKTKEQNDDKPRYLKKEYLEKLNKTKEETDKVRKESEDEITYALKKVEGDRYDNIWDGLLNEIYGVLVDQLSSEEMEALRVEQREWLEYRDNTAKEASLVYENGTMEQLEYVTVQNNLTEERCFQLVEEYMK
ncbi:hypothetical protein [Oceanobacillus iheyensis HTE831]|uniref:Lysozyme inhibitor LprI-like N-terminal domain-containing protein n=1 Tax=Oceanobacillus iheyensis (strain DSM 14371 / CIP 107618 / JCM 11309 / KCTC 3954 / HTE831) TaxID=221109 RepID=Q8ETK2_OCEIH|nr:lysozyme inhibitor LprI family protein [Oceanobacillus iheyensis]BAC12214.1 hypothetical protein [Oceanobacillus iheyensis HTE831]